MRALTLCAALVVVGCGTAGGSGGGVSNPPNGQLGPFVPLSATQAPHLNAPPFVLSSAGFDYDDPMAVALGNELVLYVTAKPLAQSDPASHSTIARSTTTDARQGFATPDDVIVADQPWEGSAVAHPSLVALADGTQLLFYSAGGAIGVARGPAGATPTLTKLGPLLMPDANEGALSSPSVVQIGSRLRLYYVARGQVWAADSALTDWSGAAVGKLPAVQRLDAKAETAERDPFVIARGSLDASIDHARARVFVTELGRRRFDVYFSGPAATVGGGVATYASAYDDGEPMQTAATPLIATGGSAAPSVLPYGHDSILFYIDLSGGLASVAIGLGPEVAF